MKLKYLTLLMFTVVVLLMTGMFLFATETNSPGVQPWNRRGAFEVTPFVGYNYFEHQQNLQSFIMYGGHVGFVCSDYFDLEATLAFINTGISDKSLNTTQEGQFRSPIDQVDVMFYHIDGVFHLKQRGKCTPFFLVGIGGAIYTPEISNRDLMTINYGLGMKYWINNHVAFRFDLGNNWITEIFVDPPKDQYAFINVNATVGITFAFGGKRKPVETANVVYVPYVTLSNPPNSSRDVPIHRRLRVAFSEPMDPATINSETFAVYYGESFVPGKVAVLTSTTASFTQKDNLDPDAVYTAKVSTGAKNLKGEPLETNYIWSFITAPMPDVKTVPIYIDKFVMLEEVYFEINKGTLTKEGEKILLQNIQILKDHPELKIRIAGFASVSGTDEYNQNLSERRANTVLAYILDKGYVSPERLDVIGYGETRPAIYEPIPSKIESKAAKSNMRVLFEVIVK